MAEVREGGENDGQGKEEKSVYEELTDFWQGKVATLEGVSSEVANRSNHQTWQSVALIGHPGIGGYVKH